MMLADGGKGRAVKWLGGIELAAVYVT